MAVQDELGPGRGAGGEIEQQGILGPGGPVGAEALRRASGLLERVPAGRGPAHGDQPEPRGEARELLVLLGRGDHGPHAAAGQAVGEVAAAEQGGGGDHHRAQLHRRQHRFPERGHIAQHQQDALAAPHAQPAEVVGQPVGAPAELGEGELRFLASLIDDPQRDPRLSLGQPVEIVEGPVEFLQQRPAEPAIGRVIVFPVADQEVAGRQKRLGIRHRLLPAVASRSARAFRRAQELFSSAIAPAMSRLRAARSRLMAAATAS